MGLITESINGLIDGVSQQAPALRRPSQGQAQINFTSSPVAGLRKRAAAQYIGGIPGEESTFYHLVNAKASEQYVISIQPGGTIRVTDLNTGTIHTPSTPDGTAYLNTSDPEVDIRATTVGDTTFIANNQVIAAMTSDTTAALPNKALVTIDQGVQDSEYAIFVDGTEEARVSTTTTPTTYETTQIAQDLKDQLDTNLGADFTVIRHGSLLVIENSSTSFRIQTFDSRSDTAMSGINRQVGTFLDLPERAPDGYTVEVMGSDDVAGDNYWVQFVSDSPGVSSVARGHWEEVPAPGVKYKLDGSTMPHTLQPDGAGGYVFKQADWNDRTAGDSTTIPEPSFVGNRIRDIFFHRHRLGVISYNNVILTGVDDLLNFWRTTATSLLDSDTIDVQAASPQVDNLSNAVPFNQTLLIFSSRNQMNLSGGEVLTPNTVSLSEVSSYNSLGWVRPRPIGRTLLFPFRRGDYSGIQEMYPGRYLGDYEASDVTAHVPSYIEGLVDHIAASSNENVVAVKTHLNKPSIWVYRFFWDNREKAQSSWSRFDFGGKVFGFDFIDDTLYLFVGRYGSTNLTASDPMHLLKIDLNENDGVGDDTLPIHLDRRIDDTQLSSTPTYDSEADETEFELPYEHGGESIRVVTRKVNSETPGLNVPVVWRDTTNYRKIRVSGDYTSTPLWFGNVYTSKYVFSEPHVRGGRSGRVAHNGRLQIRRWTVRYSRTSDFRMEVEMPNRSKRTYSYTQFGDPSLETGLFRTPITGQNEGLAVSLINDSHLPCGFLSADWEAEWVTRSRRF